MTPIHSIYFFADLHHPVRLLSASGRSFGLSAGRFELFSQERWFSWCSDDSFDINDANVACRNLGFDRANAYSTSKSLGYDVMSETSET